MTITVREAELQMRIDELTEELKAIPNQKRARIKDIYNVAQDTLNTTIELLSQLYRESELDEIKRLIRTVQSVKSDIFRLYH